MTAVFLLLAFLLLALNGFFVLAEFASVKMRSARVEEIAREGDPRARLMLHIQTNLDEYLSVCQVGITLSSIGLGFVGEPAFARLLEPLFMMAGAGSSAIAHSVAVTLAFVLVSYLHIVLGELVPKSIAIRGAEGAALVTARPLRIFHFLFYVPLLVLNGSANVLLRWIGYPSGVKEQGPSERELKITLAGLESEGRISLERVLMLENVFDLAGISVRDEMRPRSQVEVLRTGMSWDEVFETLEKSRFSRYPLVDRTEQLRGVVHVKDLLLGTTRGVRSHPPDLESLARPAFRVSEDAALEQLLRDLQRQRSHAAAVTDSSGEWVGFLTLEDVFEEIVGTIEDEFEVEPTLFIGEALNVDRVLPEIEAASIEEAIARVFEAIPKGALPAPVSEIVHQVQQREAALSTYLGSGVAIPHARMAVDRPFLAFARSTPGIPIRGKEERAHFLFFLLTDARRPRDHVRLAARVAHLFESEIVVEQLRSAETPAQILEVIRQTDLTR